ncbi:MAG: hypothetical protein WCJ57_02575 [Candidatus Falkowbacteria bacterium]
MGQINPKKSNIFKVKIVNLLLVALILVSGGFYLAGMNNLVVKGFELQKLKRQAQTLANENQEISARKVALESYHNIDSKLRDLNMVAIDKIDYLTATEDIVAKR